MTGRAILVKGKQLAQLEPADTNAASLYSPGANVVAELGQLLIANTSANNRVFRLFHDADGTTYSTATALSYDVPIAANRVVRFIFNPPLWMADENGNFAVRSDAASELTFTLYGLEHEE